MRRITDYSYLFKNMQGNTLNQVNDIRVSQIGSRSVQARLTAAGINTNSAQYKAAIKQMTSHPGSAGMFTNVQAIKNLMNTFDKDGDEINPNTGLAGVFVTEKTAAKHKRMISIPDDSREKIYKIVKENFEKNNGMTGTEGKRDIVVDLQRRTNKKDRVAAGYTLGQYEQAYAKAFVSAAKAADPSWDYGKPVPKGAFDGITRESIEANLNKTIDYKV